MDKNDLRDIVDIIISIQETLKLLKEDPLMVTESDLDILEYDLSMLNEFMKNIRNP